MKIAECFQTIKSGRSVEDLLADRRLFLTNVFYIIGITVFGIFAMVNLLVEFRFSLFVLDATAALLLAAALIDLYCNRRIVRSRGIGTAVLLVFIFLFVQENQTESFGMIWTIVVPIFVISLYGYKQGLVITALYYSLLLPLLFFGIGVWDGGNWDVVAFMRLFFISMMIVFIMVMTEYSFEQYQKIVEKLSTTDHLTNLYNRRKIDQLLASEIENSARYKTPLSIVILDIDGFKQINDRFGHLTGDKVLVELSDLLKNEIRKTDFIGRWGGEEFVIINTHTSESEAVLYADRLRMLIDEHTFEQIGKLNCSFGVCEYSEKNNNLVKMISCGDEALYRAKELGKNRVVGERSM